MNESSSALDFGSAVTVAPGQVGADILLVCEHASNRIPDHLDNLGLPDVARTSHIAWDPGALPVAQGLAKALDAPLVAGAVSRLVYDCNRPPEAESAVPERSEIYDIPGNAALDPAQRNARVSGVYVPFRQALAQEIRNLRSQLALMVTVHSFNPVYNGTPRDVEIGILHGRDAKFARTMMDNLPEDMPFQVQLNAPYSAADGVAHTLDAHGAANGLANVMIEIRNDLITTTDTQSAVAVLLAGWIRRSLTAFDPDIAT